jgi:hypothetical protein
VAAVSVGTHMSDIPDQPVNAQFSFFFFLSRVGLKLAYALVTL